MDAQRSSTVQVDPNAGAWRVLVRRATSNGGAEYVWESGSYAEACRYAAGDPTWRKAPSLLSRLRSWLS